FDRRSQIQPLLLGVTRYTRTLAEAIRVDVGDGTMMAAVKAVVSVSGLIEGHEAPPPDDDPKTPLEELLEGELPELPLPELPLDPLGTLDELLGGSGSRTRTGGG